MLPLTPRVSLARHVLGKWSPKFRVLYQESAIYTMSDWLEPDLCADIHLIAGMLRMGNECSSHRNRFKKPPLHSKWPTEWEVDNSK